MNDRITASRNEQELAPPLYASPEEELPDSVIEELVKRATRLRSDKRRRRQNDRYRILNSQHEGLISARIGELFKQDQNRKGHEQHIEISVNPAADVVESVCHLYRHGAMRRLEDADQDEAKAWQALVQSSGIAPLAPTWSPWAYFVGATIVIPSYRRNKLRLYAARPDTAEVVLDEEDPLGEPVAVSWPVGGKANLAVMSTQSLRYFKVDPDKGDYEEQEDMRADHGLGYLPVAILRFDTPHSPDDWWNWDMHRRLRDGSIAVGRVMAAMGFVRRSQNKWLLKLVGQTDSVAKGQNVAHPEKVTVARTASNQAAGDMDFDAVDFNTSPENFIKEIRLHTAAMARSTGVSIAIEGSGDEIEVTYDHAQLTELRNAQVWYAQQFEAQLWRAVVDLGKIQRDPNALAIKTDESPIEERLTVEYPVLHRDFADPKVESEWWDWQISRGLASAIDAGRRFYGPMNDEQIEARIKENTKVNRELWDQMSRGNTPADQVGAPSIGDPFQTAAQRNGAMGPAVRDGLVDASGDAETE